MDKKPKRILPIIVALCLTTLLIVWVRQEMKRRRNAAYGYLKSIAHSVLTAMQGTIQVEMKTGCMQRSRLETIMNGILKETDIRYLALMQDGKEIVAVGEAKQLPQMKDDVGDCLRTGQIVCWRQISTSFSLFAEDPLQGNGRRHPGNGQGNGQGNGWRRPGSGQSGGQGGGRRGWQQRKKKTTETTKTTATTEDEIEFTQTQRFVIAFDDHGYRNQLAAARRHLAIISIVAELAIVGLTVVWIISSRSQDLKGALRLARERDEQFKEFELAAFGLAHETRHPLGVIRALAKQITEHESIPDECRRRATEIVEESDVAASRMSEFMNYAKMKQLSPESFNAGKLIEKLHVMLKDDFAQKEISFGVQATKVNLIADRDMFQRVAINLLMNALQACSEGDDVTLSLTAYGDTAVLKVQDSGPGIPEKIRDTIFQPYVTDNVNGHGIGLTMVRKIAMEHNWRIEVSSTPEDGTTFTITGIEIDGESSEG